MEFNRYLFFILTLFLILFSISFVSANELTQADTDNIIMLSDYDDGIDDMQLNEFIPDSVNDSSKSLLSLSNDALNTDGIEDNSILSSYNENVPLLGKEIPPWASVNLYNGTVEDIANAIRANPQYAIICLNGGNYTGVGDDNAGVWLSGIDLNTVWIYGGSPNDDGKKVANINCTAYALWFGGCRLDNLRFSNVNVSSSFVYCVGSDRGYMRDTIFEDCQSKNQFAAFIGDNTAGPFEVTRCHFMNCNQTYNDFGDGSGQFIAAISADFDSCEFFNTRSGHHGGAICIADESDWYATYRASSIRNTNFTNIRSAWFAVFIHGSFKQSAGTIEKPIRVENCNFINCTGTDEYGACLGISHDNTEVINCKFINNTGGQGTAIMIGGISKNKGSIDDRAFNGDNTKGNNVHIERCTFINNTATKHQCRFQNPDGSYSWSSGNGGAVYVVGNDTLISFCDFDRNTAESGNGSAIYTEGLRTTIVFSDFTNHKAIDGTVYIEGNNSVFNACEFYNNTADCGACIYAEGNNNVVFNSDFKDNNVTNQGGAVYLEGDGSIVDSNRFIHNQAIPSTEETTGLGGAIYVKGDNTQSKNNKFEHNVARNGSAIYTDGDNFKLTNEVFNENQAWSYLLIVTPTPKVSYYNTTDVNVTVRHIGGDNIINAIHNKASNTAITLNNITYTNSRGDTVRTKAVDEKPKDGVENSQQGRFIYQDDREYLQNISLIVTYEDGSVIYKSPVEGLFTDIYGEVTVTLKKPVRSIYPLSVPLDVGDYNVSAEHPEDWNYKFIKNDNTFRVLPLADLSINKSVSKEVVHKGDDVEWTIIVTNHGPNTAVNVTVEDVIPKELINVGLVSISAGTFNADNCSWYGFNLTNGASATLVIKTTVNATNTTIVNKVNVTSNTTDSFLDNNTAENSTFAVPEADLSIVKLVSDDVVRKGDVVEWTIVVTNHGPDAAVNVRVEDVIPKGLINVRKVSSTAGVFDSEQGIWTDFDLDSGASATLVIATTVDVTNATLVNKVNTSSDTYDPFLDNNTAENSTFAVPEADLSIVKLVSDDVVRKGDVVEWTIVVTNHGPDAAVNVRVEDVIPKGLINVRKVSSTAGVFDSEQGIWSGFNLTNGASATLVISTVVNATNTTIVNKVNVTSNTTDSFLDNNTAENSTFAVPEADLSIVKLVSDDVVRKGDVVEWTIVVTNHGPDAAVNVRVEDVIPKGLINVRKVSSTAGVFDSEQGIWTDFDLDSGASATLVIATTVDVTNATLVNKVNTSSDTYDPFLDNNTAENSTFAVPEADLGINKTVSSKVVLNGSAVEWTIVVTNYGPDAAVNVTVEDVIPKELLDVTVVSVSDGQYNNGVWSGFDLANGASATLVIKTTVNATNVTIVNKVNVTSNTTDPNLDNNNASNETFVLPEADLSIVKLVSDDVVRKGDVVEWTIVVTNYGPDAAVNVTVVDVLPKELVNVTVVSVSDGQYNSGVWSGFDLANGASATLVIKTTVNATNVTIVNKVNVTSNTTDPNLDNNNASNETFVLPEADLSIVKLVSDDVVRKGDVVEWTIVVTNYGPDAAVNVTVVDVLPKELVNVTVVSVSDGQYNSGVWSGFDLANGASATLVIATTVDVTNATLVNKVNTSSDTYDPFLDNNTAENSTFAVPEADLGINKTVSSKVVLNGSAVEWTIVVTNYGPDAAVNVTVVDVLPKELLDVTVVSVSDGQYNSGVWSGFDLANGASATLVIKTTVNATNVTIVNKVNVTSNTTDPNLDNNNASNETFVLPEADLSIVKLVSDDVVRKGDVVEWTIVVTNYGPDAAVNVTVVDVLPKELVNVTVVSVSDGQYNSGVWSGFDLANGASATLVIATTVDVTNATLVNKVNTSSDTYDPFLDNNTAENSTFAVPEADLGINKTVSSKVVLNGSAVEWTIVVTNYGPDAAVNVTVVDVLPKELLDVTVVSVSDGQYNSGVWSGFDLANGASATLVIKTTVNATNVTIVNKVNVTSNTTDSNLDNNNASNETFVLPEADLSIVKLVSDDVVRKGDVVEWTIVVTNYGPDAAVNVTVVDVLPKELVNVTISSISAGEFNNGVWSRFNLANGESASLVIASIVNASNVKVINRVVVASDTHDPNLDNNNASNESDVLPEADLGIVKSVSNDTARMGDIISWEIVVTNNGPDIAINAIVTDLLPAGLEYVSDDSNGNYDSKTGIWKLGNLSNGESKTLHIVTKVSISNTTIVNNAEVTSDSHDPDESNNTDNSSVTVDPIVDLVITVEPNVNKVTVGDNIVFTVTVVNQGPDTAVNTTASVKLPKELQLLGFKPSKGTYDAEKGIWTIGDLAPGEKVELLLDTNASVSGKFVVDVSTKCDIAESDYSNNNDTTVVEVVDPITPEPVTPAEPSEDVLTPLKMHATGNPIVMAILLLLAIVGISFKRKK